MLNSSVMVCCAAMVLATLHGLAYSNENNANVTAAVNINGSRNASISDIDNEPLIDRLYRGVNNDVKYYNKILATLNEGWYDDQPEIEGIRKREKRELFMVRSSSVGCLPLYVMEEATDDLLNLKPHNEQHVVKLRLLGKYQAIVYLHSCNPYGGKCCGDRICCITNATNQVLVATNLPDDIELNFISLSAPRACECRDAAIGC